MKDKIRYDDFLKNNILTNLKINQDENLALYFLNSLNLEEDSYKKDLILCNLEDLTTNTIYPSTIYDDFEFMKDEIVLKSIGQGCTEFQIYNISKHSISIYCKVPYIVKNFCILNGDLYFVANIKEPKECEHLESSIRFPLYEESKGFIGNSGNRLFKRDHKTGRVSNISNFEIDIDDIIFDLDNKRIVFNAFKVEKFKPIASDIYIYNVEINKLEKLTDGNYRISYVGVLSREKIIFMGINLDTKKRNDNHKLRVIELSTGDCSRLEKYYDKSNESFGVLSDSTFSPSRPTFSIGDGFYFLTLEKTNVVLNKVDKEEQLSSVEIGLNTIESYQILKDGVLAIGMKGLDLQELYKFEDNDLKKISNYNKWLSEEKRLSTPEYLTIFDEDREIDGWVIPPVDIDPDKKYPAVLIVHGGPKLAFGEVYHHDMQILAAEGYFVFYANPIGSDGYGDRFLDIRGGFGSIPYEQLMNFTDKAILRYPQIDSNKLGVMGMSYGGYMANYIIGKTIRFKAAISESGISNLVTAFTSSDIGYQYILEYMNGETPWTNMEAYLEESPITRADKVVTPTMFMHGKEDHRCSCLEALNMYTALNFHGVETKLCMFEGENHALNRMGSPKNRKSRYKSIIEWFDLFLKDK